MDQLDRETPRTPPVRTRIVLIEPKALRRRGLQRLLALAGYEVRGFASARTAGVALRECDVIVAALDPRDVAARLLIQPFLAARGHDGVVQFHPRRCVIAHDEPAAAELEAGFDRVFVAPVDCSALLRWLAQHALARISSTNRDWIEVTTSLNRSTSTRVPVV